MRDAHRVERDGVDWVDGVDSVDGLTMALRRQLGLEPAERTLNAYLRFCDSSDGSKNSTATRPSIDVTTKAASSARSDRLGYEPSSAGEMRTVRVMNLSELSRFCAGSDILRSSKIQICRLPVATTTLCPTASIE